MRRFEITVLSLGILLSAMFPAAAQSVSGSGPRAERCVRVDPHGHTQVLFSILHLGLTDYYGRFDKVSGTLNYDGNQTGAQLSLDHDRHEQCQYAERSPDRRIKGDVGLQYPAISNSELQIHRRHTHRAGYRPRRRTAHDRERHKARDPRCHFNGGEQNPMGNGYALGFRATATIRRSDFGLNAMSWSTYVGNDVHLIIEAMFDQQKS